MIATSQAEDAVLGGAAVPVALVDGFSSAFQIGAVFAALGLVAALTLIRRDELETRMVVMSADEPLPDAA